MEGWLIEEFVVEEQLVEGLLVGRWLTEGLVVGGWLVEGWLVAWRQVVEDQLAEGQAKLLWLLQFQSRRSRPWK